MKNNANELPVVGMLKIGITRTDSPADQRRDDFVYPCGCYSAYASMASQGSGAVPFDYNKLIASPLLPGDHKPLPSGGKK
jgi:hypothetical protein